MLRHALVASLVILSACSNADDSTPVEPDDAATTIDPESVVAGPTVPDDTATTAMPSAPANDTTSDESAPASDLFDGERCLSSGGLERCYDLLVPAGLVGEVPLVLDLHGYTGTNTGQRRTSGFADLAVEEGFVVAWPQGYEESFNAGLCCGLAVSEGVDDVTFLRDVVADIDAVQGLDEDALYLTGLSNGCAMAQRAAADASDLFDAVACFAFYLLDDPDPGYSPVPVMEIHGLRDPVVAYTEEGRGVSDLLGVQLGAESNARSWAELNGCDPSPRIDDRGDHVLTTYQGCDADVALVTVPAAGHQPYPGAETTVDTVRLAWDFLEGS